MSSHFFEKYAQIALFKPIFCTYTYGIDESIARDISIGCRVVVPLGGGYSDGVVLSVTNSPPEKITVKPILKLVDEVPLIDERRIELAFWMARYYSAPPGECLRMFFPPGTRQGGTFIYEITPEGKKVLYDKHNSFDKKVLALIARRGPIEHKQVKKLIPHKATTGSLGRLFKKGLVTRKVGVTCSRTKFLRRQYVELKDEVIDTDKLPKRQKALIKYLQAHKGPLQLARVLKATSGSYFVAHALEKKKLIRLFVEEDIRDPFSFYEREVEEKFSLTNDQKNAIENVKKSIQKKSFAEYLLLGVTGSGKTQVYIELIKEVLSRRRNAIVLVPEIALTPLLTRRFLSHFGHRLAILHSMLSEGERHDQWFAIRRGKAQVVIGTRSSLFSPLENVGLIVIDEEHDASYKQSESPRYHAREVARRWAQLNDAVLLMGSATPSIETYYRATKKKEAVVLELPRRILKRPLPHVKVVDLEVEARKIGPKIVIASEVKRAITQRLKRGEQVMILLNRRGFSRVVLCRNCGSAIQCEHCSITMTFHHEENKLICHYCGFMRDIPEKCPDCGSRFIYYWGIGTEKLEILFKKNFPGYKVSRFDRDTTRRKGSMKKILDQFENGEIQVLIGTQMIAKGHDFPGVTLVVVLSTDISLKIPDFRAAERTFQLLTQVAGRSGRGSNPGEVYIQTYYPNHYAVRYAKTQDYKRFYSEEIFFRSQLHYPPLSRLIHILIKDKNEEKAKTISEKLGKILRGIIQDLDISTLLHVLGPAPALLYKITDYYRYSILIRFFDNDKIYYILTEFRKRCRSESLPSSNIIIDIDPVELL